MSHDDLHCPECGHNGAFDSLGPESSTFTLVYEHGKERVRENQHRIHCPECKAEFLTIEGQEVIYDGR